MIKGEIQEANQYHASHLETFHFVKQKEIVAEHVKKQNIVITTALIPGRPAPVLMTKEMIATMPPGSVIVDLAVEAGGNVEGSKRGEIVVSSSGVKIVGHTNLPGRIAESASSLFGRNLLNFIKPMVDNDNGNLNFDWEDETVLGTLVTKGGNVVTERLHSEKTGS